MKSFEVNTAPVLYENDQTVLLPALPVLDAFEENLKDLLVEALSQRGNGGHQSLPLRTLK